MPYPNYTPQELVAINSYLQAEADLARDQRNLLQEINAELAGQINNVKAASKQYRILESISKKLQEDAEEMGNLTDKQLEKELAKAKSAYKELGNSAERLATQKGIVDLSREDLSLRTDLTNQELALLKAAQQNFLLEQESLIQINKRINFTKNLNKSIGLTGSILKSVSSLTDKLGLHGIDYIFEDAAQAAKDKAKALGVSDVKALGLVGKFKVMLSTIKPLTSGLMKAATDPLFLLTAQIALFKKIFDLNKDINKRQTEQQQSLGISADQSQRLAQSTFEYANATNDVFVTEKRLTEGRNKLNELLGTSVVYTNQSVEGFERLTHYYGVSEDSAAKLTELATQQGQSTKDILNSTIRVANEQKRQFGGTMSYQKVLQKVSSTGGEILTKFKGNTQELAKAVMNADRLGLNLEQVNKIGESLLDFESSIENELKAELLTGKQINLEKARAAALSGDLAKLTTEIASQTGGIANFQRMNVIQQKAYAEAFGMTAAEMGDMLRKREFENKLGADAKKSAEEQLKLAEKRGIKIEDSVRKELEAKSLADKQKYVFEKLAEVLGKLTSGPMQKFMSLLSKALGFVEKIFSFFGKMTGGPLGDALGAAIIGAPLLIGGVRMLTGGIKSMLLGARGSTIANPQYVYDVSGGGGGGVTDMLGGGKSIFSGRGKGLLRGGFGRGKNMTLARSLRGGMKGFGIGAAIGIGADLVAGQMEEGAAQDTVSGIGTTASWAGTGALIGSVIPGVGTAVGAVVGGLAGAMSSLFTAEENRIKREEARKKTEEDQNKRTNELLEQLALRPNVLNVGGKTIMEFNTAADQYGTRGSSFN